jgi:hypothetical protein
MMNETKTQAALGIARQELKDTLERVKELRVKIANLRLDVAAERAERKVARAEKRAAKIAAMEARVAEMRLKANAPKQIRKNYRKASDAVVYTAEQIAALNAERGLA